MTDAPVALAISPECPQEPVNKVYVVGLLGSTDMANDWWMATDYLMWKELLADATDSRWLAGAIPKQPQGANLGDPRADRLNFKISLESILVLPKLSELFQDFLDALHDVMDKATENDKVVIVICAHGQQGTGDVCMGSRRSPLFVTKTVVEKALRKLRVPQDRVFVVSTACYSGKWRSNQWTLLAAAEEDQLSDAMSESASNECRGGFFTWALLGKVAEEQGLAIPLSEEINYEDTDVLARMRADIEVDMRHPYTPGNLKDLTVPRVLKNPRSSLNELHSSTNLIRDRVEGVYKSTDSVVCPPSHLPSTFPIRMFNSEFLSRFHVVGPSPLDIITPDSPTLEESYLSESELAPLEPAELEELGLLATAYDRQHYPTKATDVPLILNAAKFVSGVTLPMPVQRALLSRLRYHGRACRRATAIAASLGWTVAEPVEDWRPKSGLAQLNAAQQAGVDILELFLGNEADGAQVGEGEWLWRTPGPAQWLAHAWVLAGKPAVESEAWDAALRCGEESAHQIPNQSTS